MQDHAHGIGAALHLKKASWQVAGHTPFASITRWRLRCFCRQWLLKLIGCRVHEAWRQAGSCCCCARFCWGVRELACRWSARSHHAVRLTWEGSFSRGVADGTDGRGNQVQGMAAGLGFRVWDVGHKGALLAVES